MGDIDTAVKDGPEIVQTHGRQVNLPTVIPQPRGVLTQLDQDLVEKVIAGGDLAVLTPKERNALYLGICRTYGMNPLTRPLEYLVLNGKKLLYVRKEGADQLRLRWGVSVEIVSREVQRGAYVVVVRASLPDGRTDSGVGSVWVGDPEKERDELPELEAARDRMKKENPKVDPKKLVSGKWTCLVGDSFSNAIMKAETKAKRRATLSIVGLGWLDESQIGSIDGAREINIGEDEIFLSLEQLSELQGAVKKAGIAEKTFLKGLSVTSWDDVTVADFKTSLKKLEAGHTARRK